MRAAPGHGDGTTRECGAGRPAAVKYAGGAAAVTHPPPAIPRRSPLRSASMGRPRPAARHLTGRASTPRGADWGPRPGRDRSRSDATGAAGGTRQAKATARAFLPAPPPCPRARPLFSPQRETLSARWRRAALHLLLPRTLTLRRGWRLSSWRAGEGRKALRS